MKKALITGVTGFAGSYLAKELLDNGYNVSGTYHSDDSLKKLPEKDKITLYKLNLLDEKSVLDLIRQDRPDYIFHLAAMASAGNSINNPSETFNNNVTSEINLLEAIRKNELLGARVLIVSSAEVYGLVSEENLPIDEETPFNPTNPYAVSKLAQDYLGLQYFLSEKIQIVRVRPFNHIGPRQSPDFVVSGFAKRIVDIERGKEKDMKVGNLKSKRDFTSVEDIVRAYRMALEQGIAGDVYNLGSGKSYEIQSILDMMIGMSKIEIQTVEDPALMRPSDNPDFVCDYSKFKDLTGWTPQVPIEKALEDTLEYWRSQN